MASNPSKLSRNAIAAISAVEGLTLLDAAQKRQREADQLGLSPAQRQAAIAIAYRASVK
jgi:threonine/homoserine efflux transporter RhtA